MRHLLSVLALSFVVVAPCAAQQIVPCPPGFPPFLNFSPSTPNASQAITITVQHGDYRPTNVVATLQGNVVNVTLTATSVNFNPPPPVPCVATSIGPLPAGTYVVNFFVQPIDTPVPPPFIATTATLIVTPDLSRVPAISTQGLAALTIFLTVAGWFALRRST